MASNGPSYSYRKYKQEKNPKFNTIMLDKELKNFIKKHNQNGKESTNPIIRAMYDPDAVDRALDYR